jgi:sulfur carrier protein
LSAAFDLDFDFKFFIATSWPCESRLVPRPPHRRIPHQWDARAHIELLPRPVIPCDNRFAMKLIINGQDQTYDPLTLANLVEQLGMKQDRVAVELNRNIVPRGQWAETQLAEGDQLEIVHFVGGGSSS